MPYSRLSRSLLAALLFALPSTAYAGKAENKIIANTVEAYGIEDLKSITMLLDLRYGGIGQGYTPELHELNQMVKDIKIDLVNMRGSEESWGGPHNPYNLRAFNNADGVTRLNYVTGLYRVSPDDTYYSRFGGEIRSSDTVLAYELNRHAKSATLKNSEKYRGQMHDVLELDMPGPSPLLLYIDQNTGLISKMYFSRNGRKYTMQYGTYKVTDGVTYADDLDYYVDGVMGEYAKGRTISINDVDPKTFEVDAGISLQPPRIPYREMSIDAVGDIIHHVGKGGGYSSFIDAEDHAIGMGGYAGLTDRWDAFQADHEDKAELRYHIVTHHHDDHLRGIIEAVELGATLIIPTMAIDTVKAKVGPSLTDDKIKALDRRMTLGPVEIYNIATTHVKEFALVYIPSEKTIFQVDHYNGIYPDQVSMINHHTMSLISEVERLDLDVNTILSAHGRKAEKWADVLAASKDYIPGPCPTGHAICQ